MRRISKVLGLLRIRLLQDFLSFRVLLVFALMALYVAAALKPMREFGDWAGCGVAPGIFVFLVDEHICQLVLCGAALVMFSRAPFRSDMDNYLLPRAGRLSLAMGNCLYILIVSVLYIGALFLTQTACLNTSLNLGDGWGKLIRSLGQGIVPDGFNSEFFVNNSIVRIYDANRALMNVLSLETLCIAFLGMVIYVGNRAFAKPVGLWIGGGFVMLDLTIYNMLPEAWNAFSPLALPRLSSYAYRYYMPLGGSVAYGYLFLVSGIIALIAIALLEEKHLSAGGRQLFTRKGVKRK
ncbi:MAG: hypothetical protein E7337_00160 [Clostridiales bacterium]|nr:hypothetical protein [Clostridiales bacterium]